MSHFTVMVVGKDPEGLLAPFQENNCGDCPREYLKFNDVEEEYRKEYENDSKEMIKMPDGTFAFSWDERFRVDGTMGTGSDTHKVPDNLERVQVPHKQRYATFDDFMRDWAGYRERDADTGRYGRWENPNRKWDWYQIGGRWDGYLKLKNGTTGNQAPKRAIDFDTKRKRAEEDARAKYRWAYSEILKDLPPNATWEVIRTEQIKDDMGLARKFYWNQPRCKAWQEYRDAHRAESESLPVDLYFDDSPDDFLCSEDEYARRAGLDANRTFAFLRNGKWAEKGKMGWWAAVHDEKADWPETFQKLLDDVPDDELITIVDCHI